MGSKFTPRIEHAPGRYGAERADLAQMGHRMTEAKSRLGPTALRSTTYVGWEFNRPPNKPPERPPELPPAIGAAAFEGSVWSPIEDEEDE